MAETPHITVKLPQLSPYPLEEVLPGDLIYVWEIATGILRNASVSQLPFGSGSGGGTALGSPFKVRQGDEQVEIIDNGDGTFSTKISDIRLLGKTDYPVNSSQVNNGSFRDDELIYDSVEGSVTIINILLNPDEIIVLYPDGVQSGSGGGGALQPLIDRITELERISAPFRTSQTGQPNGGLVLWLKPANEIPVGWVEAIEMRGKFPLGIDPAAIDPNQREIYQSGGAFKKSITIAEMPNHSHTFTRTRTDPLGSNYETNRLRGGSDRGLWTGTNENTSPTGNGDPFDFTNPYRIVNYIRYVGV